jgi:serine/threonine protein kinase
LSLVRGDKIAEYTVEGLLGIGGMGAVYRVRHPRLPRSVALKLLHPQFAAEPRFAARFLHEAEMAARLSHRNIVDVFDRGEDGGQLWVTMRLVDGVDGDAALKQAGGLFPLERAVYVVGEVASALDYAHKNNVVHRDIKPANILITAAVGDDDPESVYLADFGIAKALDSSRNLTQAGAVLASFAYASPEQIESRPLDGRTDIYSLGCVFFQLLTGRVPYPFDALPALIHAHLEVPPPRPTAVVPWLPASVDDVVATAMAKDRAERYPTARALAKAAAESMAQFSPAPDPPFDFRMSQWTRTAIQSTNGSTRGAPPLLTSRIGDTLARSRFFDLPDRLTPPEWCRNTRPETTGRSAGALPTVIEIASARATRRVAWDPDSAFKPPGFDELMSSLAEIAQFSQPSSGGQPPAPTTVVHLPTQDRLSRDRRADTRSRRRDSTSDRREDVRSAETPTEEGDDDVAVLVALEGATDEQIHHVEADVDVDGIDPAPAGAPHTPATDAGGDGSGTASVDDPTEDELPDTTGSPRSSLRRRLIWAAIFVVTISVVALIVVLDKRMESERYKNLLAYVPRDVSCYSFEGTSQNKRYSTPDGTVSASAWVVCDDINYNLWSTYDQARDYLFNESTAADGEFVDGNCVHLPEKNARITDSWSGNGRTAIVTCERTDSWFRLAWVIDGHPVSSDIAVLPTGDNQTQAETSALYLDHFRNLVSILDGITRPGLPFD